MKLPNKLIKELMIFIEEFYLNWKYQVEEEEI